MPKYPVYIPSKGRVDTSLTANFLLKDGVDFRLVVEPQEADSYIAKFGKDKILILPFSNLGMGSTPARNWIRDHSKEAGYSRHWILDDNMRCMRYWHKGKRLVCNANLAMGAVEEFTDRYENIGISGLNYTMFAQKSNNPPPKPFYLNVHVYSCILLDNQMPYKWRLRYNEDTDLCLQVLDGGLCTVLFNAFMVDKMQTMTMKGGNSDQLYKADGRLKMARMLEAAWPQYVKVKWRFGRPQHVINNNWRDFKTPLKRRTDIDWDQIRDKKYSFKITKVKEIKSTAIQNIYNESLEA